MHSKGPYLIISEIRKSLYKISHALLKIKSDFNSRNRFLKIKAKIGHLKFHNNRSILDFIANMRSLEEWKQADLKVSGEKFVQTRDSSSLDKLKNLEVA